MIRTTVYRAALIAALIACTACLSTGRGLFSGSGSSGSLDTWLEKSAGPELAKLMGEHPMFKNQAFLIAALDKEEITPLRDDVTRQVRDRLTASLLGKPGVALAWRPDAERPVAFEDLSDPGSRQLPKIYFYVGIETAINSLDGMMSVNVRVLDVDEKRWVPGVHLSWRGRPTEAQEQALARAEKAPRPALKQLDKPVIEPLTATPSVPSQTKPQPKPGPAQKPVASPASTHEDDKGFD